MPAGEGSHRFLILKDLIPCDLVRFVHLTKRRLRLLSFEKTGTLHQRID
jgi:hypothetical protein